ncbi:unnamed protein product [Calicophoron daubneyi]
MSLPGGVRLSLFTEARDMKNKYRGRYNSLYRKLGTLQNLNERLLIENNMFERCAAKLLSEKTYPATHPEAVELRRSGSIRTVRFSKATERFVRLSPEQKCRLARDEVEDMRRGLSCLDREGRSVVGEFEACINVLANSTKSLNNNIAIFEAKVASRVRKHPNTPDWRDAAVHAFILNHKRYTRDLDMTIQTLRLANEELSKKYKKLVTIKNASRASVVEGPEILEMRVKCDKAVETIRKKLRTCVMLKRLLIESTNACDKIK